MAYRKKIYVSYDAADILYYNMLEAWCRNETQEFVHHESILLSFPETKKADNIGKTFAEKITTTTCFIVLVGNHTVSLGQQMKIEIEKAIELDIPIIIANLNGKRSIDNDLCPLILKNQMALHVSFNAKILQEAINTWPTYYLQNKDKGSGAYFFKPEVYNRLGL